MKCYRLSWNAQIESFFFFFFHLSNNWFDISEHFKGSLARRLCSKLQYKAEDLPLAECQVYASASLPHPVRRRHLLASHPLPPLSLSFLPEPSESKLYTTCLHCPVCVCFCASVSRSSQFIVTLQRPGVFISKQSSTQFTSLFSLYIYIYIYRYIYFLSSRKCPSFFTPVSSMRGQRRQAGRCLICK